MCIDLLIMQSASLLATAAQQEYSDKVRSAIGLVKQHRLHANRPCQTGYSSFVACW